MGKGKYNKWLEKENLEKIEQWAKNGLDLSQISHNIGIQLSTLRRWREAHKEIDDAIVSGQTVSITETKNSLYDLAKGKYVTETEATVSYDADGNKIGTVVKKKTRYIPANFGAICFILKNKAPDEWRDSPTPIESRVTVDDGFIQALRGTAKEDWKEETAESDDVNAE